jgi:hypothetical protein
MNETKCFFMVVSVLGWADHTPMSAVEQMSQIGVVRRFTAEAGIGLAPNIRECLQDDA